VFAPFPEPAVRIYAAVLALVIAYLATLISLAAFFRRPAPRRRRLLV